MAIRHVRETDSEALLELDLALDGESDFMLLEPGYWMGMLLDPEGP